MSIKIGKSIYQYYTDIKDKENRAEDYLKN